GFLLRKNKIEHVPGTGKLLPRGGPSKSPPGGASRPHQIQVALNDGGQRTVDAKHVIIATGARARSLPGVVLDDKRIIEYRRAMTLPAQPKSLVVLGAGAIGVEFASFYHALGVDVTIVEFLPRLVPNEDAEVSKELQKAFDRRGIKSLVGHKLTKATNTGDRVELTAEPAQGGQAKQLTADILLVAVGIAANTENIGLEQHGIQLERGFIKVDRDCRCGDNLWAIGDVAGRGLAHVASAEGVFVAEKIAGVHAEPVRYDAIPACTYCHPEIASVGLTEDGAKAQNIPIKVGHFPWRPLGRAMASGETIGFVKVMWHERTGELVGAHMIGPAVTDLIAELTLAKTTEVNAESLIYTIHAHPTFAEAIRGATEEAFGHAIDL
ncbi:MAG: FAD-dependent oxidoreductase, partial [Acidobacteriota bacterium]